jgi:hypothetical protein
MTLNIASPIPFLQVRVMCMPLDVIEWVQQSSGVTCICHCLVMYDAVPYAVNIFAAHRAIQP